MPPKVFYWSSEDRAAKAECCWCESHRITKINWSLPTDSFPFVFSAHPSFYPQQFKVEQNSFYAAVGGLLSKSCVCVFEKICCFVCHDHSIVTTGLSQLVTMDGLHTVCLLVAGLCRWSVFSSLLPCVDVKHKNAPFLLFLFLSVVLSLHSDFKFCSVLSALPTIHHFFQTNTVIFFISFLQ